MSGNPETNIINRTPYYAANLLHLTRWKIALLGATAAFAFNADPLGTNDPLHNLGAASAIAQENTQQAPPTSHHSSREGVKHCSSIRKKPNDIYMGFGCREDGATFNLVEEVPVVKGWRLGVMVVDGIYKCGFARTNILPSAKLQSGALSLCKGFYPLLVEGNYTFFEDWNCSDTKPCQDATFYTPVSRKCPTVRTYHNYATNKPSPFNMYGTGDGGFSDTIKDSAQKYLHYRVRVKPSSEDGKAIVVRNPKWSLTRDKCAAKGRVRRGGTRLKRPG